jgi:hypothetical protein
MPNLTGIQQGSSSATAVQPALSKDQRDAASKGANESPRKHSGYGLPCAKCHLYYPADLDYCPICHHKDRVSAVVPRFAPKTVQAESEEIPDTAVLEREREEFLRQFKSQLREAHTEIMEGTESICIFAEHHPGEPAGANVCSACYDRMQERVDILEAALRMELKEAAQIIYDAVWADPSDPGQTYQNAASALLSELRKRAGITAVLSPFQPLAH